MKILIAGGGIGGLAAALSCAGRGHHVVVLERQDTGGLKRSVHQPLLLAPFQAPLSDF
ncbi:MAG: FAD-dependent oxidoreductase [Pseudonocardiaceae bacterium]